MRKALFVAGMFLLSSAALPVTTSVVFADEYVHGYHRKDGTYVQPHYRSDPDGNPYNNYSFPGNTNPYTGERATGNPDTYLRGHDRSNGLGSDRSFDSDRSLYGR